MCAREVAQGEQRALQTFEALECPHLALEKYARSGEETGMQRQRQVNRSLVQLTVEQTPTPSSFALLDAAIDASEQQKAIDRIFERISPKEDDDFVKFRREMATARRVRGQSEDVSDVKLWRDELGAVVGHCAACGLETGKPWCAAKL
jgi:hypothetical protein